VVISIAALMFVVEAGDDVVLVLIPIVGGHVEFVALAAIA
jgi:hypothetical protein